MVIDECAPRREEAAAARAIALGYTITKHLGADECLYVLQTHSGLTLGHLEELLDFLEAGVVRRDRGGKLIPLTRPDRLLAAGLPFETEDQARWAYPRRVENGSAVAFVRVGRRVFVHLNV
jgi:hypothetical protein